MEEIEQEEQAKKLIEADVNLPEVPNHSLADKNKPAASSMFFNQIIDTNYLKN